MDIEKIRKKLADLICGLIHNKQFSDGTGLVEIGDDDFLIKVIIEEQEYHFALDLQLVPDWKVPKPER